MTMRLRAKRMDWKPISEVDLWGLINESYERMTLEQRRIWETIKVDPLKWSQEPYGRKGGGFWVVAIIGNTVIWFNNIENGFNRSTFTELGNINDYYCNQDELESQVQNLINQMRDGYDAAGYCGAPRPIT